jgi:hypothetical protein
MDVFDLRSQVLANHAGDHFSIAAVVQISSPAEA